MHQISVITCSERALEDPAEDRAGSVLRSRLEDMGFQVAPPTVVGMQAEAIAGHIVDAIRGGARIVFTTGGSGLLPQDVTVEATLPLVDRQVPGIMEEVRRRGAQKTPLALLSRGVVGIVALPGYPRALVINAPGSRGGARDTLAVVGPMLERIIDSLDGVDHDLSRPPSDGSQPSSHPSVPLT